MKDRNLLFILVCSIFIMGTIACERTEIQKSFSKDDTKINTRTDDCEDCPVDDCCCAIYATGSEIVVEICGATGNRLSTRPCGPIDAPTSCIYDIGTTYYHGSFSIGSGFGPQIFCVPENATFLVNVISGSGTASITCQYGQIGAQTITPTLTALNRYFFNTDSDCLVGGCQ